MMMRDQIVAVGVSLSKAYLLGLTTAGSAAKGGHTPFCLEWEVPSPCFDGHSHTPRSLCSRCDGRIWPDVGGGGHDCTDYNLSS
jgi:hypothetical protein